MGIDPGLNGGIAFLGDGLLTFPMPTKKRANGKTEIDAKALFRIIRPYHQKIKIAAIEKVHSMPGQGVASTFSFGQGYGAALAVLEIFGFPTMRLSPAVWKSALNLNRDKRASLAMARNLWPSNSEDFKRLKDDGRAEAALMAYFVSRSLRTAKQTISKAF